MAESAKDKQEACVTKLAIKLITATLCVALIGVPAIRPALAGGDPPTSSPPPPDPTPTKGKRAKRSSLDGVTSTAGYRTAYATIYDRNDYAAAIDQLKALGQDDNASVCEVEQADRGTRHVHVVIVHIFKLR